MIAIRQPALVLNAIDAPRPYIQMWSTGYVGPLRTATEMMIWINSVAAQTPNGQLEALVLNSHGMASHTGGLGFGLAIGERITNANVSCFNLINGRVKKIFITACGAAHISSESTPGGPGDGHYLMSRIARFSHAEVIAGTETQVVASSIPINSIHNYEGLVAFYNNRGHLVRTVRRPSTYMLFDEWTDNG